MSTSVPVALVNMTAYGPDSQLTTCPSCGYEGMTQTRAANGILTWLIFGLFILCGCWFGCCLIPFCFDCCRNKEHYCNHCKAYLGVYKRI
ncbi:hypothetical protein CHUAL_007969 [Chamberlinius hualienensis]